MISEWVANKFRFLANALFVLVGVSVLVFPWLVALLIIVLALVFDFLAFSFQKKGAAE